MDHEEFCLVQCQSCDLTLALLRFGRLVWTCGLMADAQFWTLVPSHPAVAMLDSL